MRHRVLIEGLRLTPEAEPDEALLEGEEFESDPFAGEPEEPAYQRRTAEAPPPVPGEDPALRAARYAQILLAQEERARSKRARGGPGSRDEEPSRTPFKVIPRRSRPDSTLVLDPVTGKPPESVKPGWLLRHVSATDWMGRPTEARIADMEDYGGEVVADANGRAIESRYGVVMQIALEQAALRTADKTPSGATSRQQAFAEMEQLSDMANRAAGTRVASVTEMPEHGSRRKWGRPGDIEEE